MVTVLYVDDEPGLLEIGKLFLETTAGFAVDILPSAAEALAVIQEKEYDAIISDYQMPVMDGIAFLKAVRKGGYTVPFILFTGRGREEVVIEAINNGADFYLQKGGDPKAQFAELAHKILRAVEGRRTEIALVESERRFRNLTENSLDTIMLFDRDLRYLYVNPNAEAQTGIPAARFIGRTHAELGFPQDLVELWQRTLNEVFQSGRNHRIEFQVPTGLWIDWLLVPIHAPDGSVIQVITSARDITEQKKAEADLRQKNREIQESCSRLQKVGEVLRENQERLRTFMDSATDAFTIWDAGFNLIDLNPAALSYLPEGTTKEEILGKNYREFMPASQKSGDFDRYREVMRTGVPFYSTDSFTDLQSGRRWLNVRIFRVADGLGIVTTDITQQKKAEEELRGAYEQLAASEEELRRHYAALALSEQKIRESEEKYRSFMEASSDGAFLIAPGGQILAWNPAAEQIFGIAEADAIGMNILDLNIRSVVPEHRSVSDRENLRSQFAAEFPALFDRESPLSLEVEMVNARGRRMTIQQTLFPIRISHGKLVGSIVRDVTEQRAAEEKVRVSEKIYRSVIENIQDVYYRSDRDGNLIMASPSSAALLGYDSVDEILGKPVAETFYSDPAERAVFLAELQKTGNVSNFDTRLKKKDGSEIFVSTNSHWYQDLSGAVAGVEGIIRDITDRKRAEDALRESEERYRTLIETSPDPIIMYDLSGKILSANAEAARIYGAAGIDDFLSEVKTVFDVLTADGRAFAEENFKRTLKQGASQKNEYTVRRRDGSIIITEINSSLVKSATGGPAAFISVIRDITDRKRAEDALRGSEERFRGLVETSPDMLWEIDLSGTFRYISPRVRDILGYEPSELTGRPVLLLVGEHAREFVRGEMAKHAAAKTGLFTLEVPARHKDGRDLAIEIRSAPITDASGTVTGLRGTAHDITVRRQALSALAESEENYRKLVATVPDIVVRTDLNGNILFANEKVLQLGGYSGEREIIGTPVFAFFAPEDLPRAIDNTRLMFERQLGPVEYTFITRDGTRHLLEINGDVLRNPDGTPSGMVYVGRDVTQRKKAEEAIRSAHRQLDLLSSVTRHDILNKVSVQLGLLALAKRKVKNSPEMAVFIGKLESAAQAIREQIEFTRIYQDLGSHEPQWQDLHRTLAKIPVPPHLSVSDTGDGTEVFADVMLEKVFGNLVDNAIRHGGTVTTVTMTAEEDHGTLIIRFGDNGAGIPKDEKERIFERGYGKNTGLGLFLVREVLALTGITIRETGEPGKGARFEMVVPAGSWRIRAAA
jgi:PAS domain S-box-containing protein